MARLILRICWALPKKAWGKFSTFQLAMDYFPLELHFYNTGVFWAGCRNATAGGVKDVGTCHDQTKKLSP